jgi:hypothetical protein
MTPPDATWIEPEPPRNPWPWEAEIEDGAAMVVCLMDDRGA